MKRSWLVFLCLAFFVGCATKKVGKQSATNLGEMLRLGVYDETFHFEEGFAACLKQCLEERERDMAAKFLEMLEPGAPKKPVGIEALYAELLAKYEGAPRYASGVLYFGWYFSGATVATHPEIARNIFRQVMAGLRKEELQGGKADGFLYLVALEKSTGAESREAKIQAAKACLAKEAKLARCEALKSRLEKQKPERRCEADKVLPALKIYFAGKRPTSFYTRPMKSYGTRSTLHWGTTPQFSVEQIKSLRWDPEGAEGSTLFVELSSTAAETLKKLGKERLGRFLVVTVGDLEIGSREVKKAFGPEDSVQAFPMVPETAEKSWETICPSMHTGSK